MYNNYLKIFDFNGVTGGGSMGALVQASNGLLYGTTSGGGTIGSGNIFQFDVTTNVSTNIFNFTVLIPNSIYGRTPICTLIEATSGFLYGTNTGGGQNNLGTIFTYEIATSTCNVIHNFDYVDGYSNIGGLLLASDGFLYGTAVYGGSAYATLNYGVIFKCQNITSGAATYSVVYDFSTSITPNDGQNPSGGLLQASDGKIYGITSNGGQFFGGTIFRFDPLIGGSSYEKIYDFDPTVDGYMLESIKLVENSGILYGATSKKFPNGTGGGAIFMVDIVSNPITPTVSILYNIDESIEGSNVSGNFVYKNNILYGVLSEGPGTNFGAVFAFDYAGATFTIIEPFTTNIEGKNPIGGLMEASNNKLYGTTYNGGQFNSVEFFTGTIFELFEIPPIEGCIITGLTVTGCSDFVIVDYSGQNITCLSDGTIYVEISGGCPDYIYTLYSDTFTQLDQYTASTTNWTFTGITNEGNYYFSVTDCSGNTISILAPITIDYLIVDVNGYQLSSTQYCIELSGGTPPYTIIFGNLTLTGLTADTYCFDVDCNETYNYYVSDSTVDIENCVAVPSIISLNNPFNQGGCINGEIYLHPRGPDINNPAYWPAQSGSPGWTPTGETGYMPTLLPYANLQQPPLGYISLSQFAVPNQPCNIGFPGYPNLTEWYQLEFFGIINIPVTGNYQFSLASDDGAIFTISNVSTLPAPNQYILDNGGMHWSLQVATSSVFLTAGSYPFTMSYYQGPPYDIALELKWLTPGSSTFEYVPVDAFSCDTECICVVTGQTTIQCLTPTITISGTNLCCINDGTVTIDVTNGIPNYTITGTNQTTGEEIIFSASSSTIFIDHLTAGNWIFTILDSGGNLINVNNSITLTSQFFVDVFSSSTTTTGTTFCFSGQSCLNEYSLQVGATGGQITSINVNPTPLSWDGSQGVFDNNTLYCFDIPIEYCGQDVMNLTFYSGLFANSNVFSGSFTNPTCQTLFGSFGTTEGTWVNGYPAFWFSLNNGDNIVVYFDLTLNLWVWKNRNSGTICATSPNLTTWTTINTGTNCQCVDNISTATASIQDSCGFIYETIALPCPDLFLSGTSTNPFCDENCNGTITLTLTGGNSPYTYQLTDFSGNTLTNGSNQPTIATNITNTTYTFTNLCEGTYYPVVIDSEGVSATTTPLVLSNTFVVNVDLLPVIINGTGSTLCFTVSGGSGTYNITIQDNTFVYPPVNDVLSDGQTCFDLPFGCYDWTIVDPSTGCDDNGTVCISDTPFGCETYTYIDPTCGNTGELTVGVSGGTGPYQFDLYLNGIFNQTGTNVVETFTFQNLIAGTYNVLVTDLGSGTVLDCVTVTLIDTFSVQFISGSTCENLGYYCVSFSGGNAPYFIQFDQTTQYVSYLDGTYCYEVPCGTYELTVSAPNDGTPSLVDLIPDYDINNPSEWNIAGIWNFPFPDVPGTISGGLITLDNSQTPNPLVVYNEWAITVNNYYLPPTNSFTLYYEIEVGVWPQNNTTIKIFDKLLNEYVILSPGQINPNSTYTGNITFNNQGTQPASTIQFNIVDNTAPVLGRYYEIKKIRLQYESYISSGMCVDSQIITIPCGVDLSATTVGNLCGQNGQGSITVFNIGGTPSFLYSINGGLTYQSSNYFPGLNSGTYDVAIVDSSGCTANTQVTIGYTDNILVTATTTPENCNYTSGGTITISASGGNPPYTYSFNGGAPTSQTYYTGLTIGTYTITVTDTQGCITTLNSVIDGPINLSGSSTAVNCEVTNSGTITINPSGGNTPYQYSMDGGGFVSTNYFTGLTEGLHTYIVLDASGCTATGTTEVGGALEIETSVTSIDCLSTSSATICVTSVLGGDPPYTYSINSGSFSSSNCFSGLSVGSYTITAQDISGCSATTVVLISPPIPIVVDTNVIDAIICLDGTSASGGTIIITASNGTPIYYYSIDNGLNYQTLNTFVNVPIGTYNIVVKDSLNCTGTTTATIGVRSSFTISATSTPDNCSLTGLGSLTIDIIGGFPPYYYSIDGGLFFNGPTNSTSIYQGGLTSGTYDIVVEDSSGCTATTQVTVITSEDLTLSVVTTPENCDYNSGGTATITVSGGTPPFTYSLNGGTPVSSNYFTGLTIGSYTVTVTDSLGCIDTITFVIDPPINITGDTTSETCDYNSGGTITVTASSGTPPYQYSVDGGPFTNLNYFTGLTVGSHTILIVDASGCTASTVTYIDPPIVLSAVSTPENCLYTSAGTITIVSTIGGTPPYQYSVNGGSYTNLTFYSGLTVGTYTVNVIDISGCSATTQVIIDNPIPVSGDVITTNLDCNNTNIGTLLINAYGGTSPYTYSVNGSAYTSQNYYTGLSAGTYNVTINDVYGCSATTVGVVSTATPITVSAITVTAATCSGLSEADLTLIANGGTSPYTFLWQPINSNLQTVNSNDYVVSAGTYSYTGTVIDRFGCSASTTVNFTIVSAITPTLQILSSGTLSCDSSTFVTISAITSTSYDQIYWSNSEVGVTTITANTPGTYSYYITIDDCEYYSESITIDIPASTPPLIGFDEIICVCSSTEVFLLDNGYTYTDILWNNNETGNTISVSSCTAGTYTYYLTALDEYNCPVTSNTVTIIFSELEIDIFTSNAVCLDCGICIDGYAEVTILNGTPPYIFTWSGIDANTNILTDLQPGNYSVTVTDAAGCSASTSFDISGVTLIGECTYEPVTDLNGNIILNGDGTISFYNPDLPNIIKTTYSPTEDCCLSNSTPELPLLYCDCRCYWRRQPCEEETFTKLILGTNGNNGVQLISDTPKNNQSIVCQYQVSFDFLFNFDCQKLYDCIGSTYSGSVLTFLSGLSASATIEVLSGNSYVTKQIQPIWEFDFYKQPTGVYFGGENNACDIINQSIFTELGSNCTAYTETTFAPVWQSASFKVLDSLSGQTIKIGLILDGFSCDYNILLDKLKIEEVCVVSTENILSDDGCPGFDLVKVVDNKKSWIYNEDFYDRDWFHLKYRDTSYDDYHERLDINTKEVDLDISVSRAIDYDIYCYSLSEDCFTFSGCNYPNLILQSQAPSGSPWIFFPNPTTYTGSVLTFIGSGFTLGETYDFQFTFRTTGLNFFLPTLYISFGVKEGGVEKTILDNITGSTYNSTITYNFTQTILGGSITQFSEFFVRIINASSAKQYALNFNDIVVTRHCDPNNVNPSSIFSIPSGTTFNQFKDIISTQTINVMDRQVISDYPLLRYLFDKYLGLCGLDNCNTSSNQYNYNTLNDFVALIGDYWIDLVEQLVPATTIWGGSGGARGTRTYKNSIFDQPKFEYRSFGLGYCDTEYCFEGNDGEPTYSAACYVAQYGNKQLTNVGFSGVATTIATAINSTTIGNTILLCSDNTLFDCCNINPLGCFVSGSYGLTFTEGTNVVTASTNTFTSLSGLPTTNDYLTLLYTGLINLGYTNLYPYNTLNWSKETNSGCSDDIQITPSLTVKYSCITATTITSTTVSVGELVFEPLFSNFPQNYTLPFGKFVMSGSSMIYGVVQHYAGTTYNGYVYRWTGGTSLSVIKYFIIGTDGIEDPASGLVLASDGSLYGTTLKNNGTAPGSNPNYGALYKINPNTGLLTVLKMFGLTDGGRCWNGQELLLHSDGNIYIPMSDANVCSIYKWDVISQTGSILYNFNTGVGSIFLSEDTMTGLIYGTTTGGGGFIFRIDPTNPLGTYSVRHTFNSSNPSPNNIIGPSGSLVKGSGSYYYGLTTTGGLNGYMSLYRFDALQTPNNGVTVLHLFVAPTPPEGRNPKGNLVILNNVIYGICTTGGNGYGNIFQYDIGNSNYEGIVKQFDTTSNNVNGQYDFSTFANLQYNSTNGYIYGMAPRGGLLDRGTIFRFGFSGTTGSTTTTITGTGIFECTVVGNLTNTSFLPWEKTLVNFSSDTYVTATTISGISCTEYCSGYVENPNVEVIVEDITNQIDNPCAEPIIVERCNLVYATHTGNDVWFDGKVTVINPINPTQENDGSVLITNDPGQA